MFSAPLWLLGLFALLIPLLLHLWSRKPRQVIRVGTLRHVDLTADARSWSARLTEPLLLAVRLALLATIVFALAGLRLPIRRSTGSSGDLVLVDPALLRTPASLPFLDSLVREHELVRLLTPGLPKFQLGSAAVGETNATDLWARLAEADALVGAGGMIHVVARPRLVAMGGVRPRLRATVTWHAPAPDDSSRWAIADFKRDSLERRVRVEADTAGERRIVAAVRAIGEELKVPVVLVSTADSADIVITGRPQDDSLLGLRRSLILLSPATIASNTLVDSIWARWPSQTAPDSSDQRVISTAQALASRPIDAPAPLGDPEGTRRGLLLLALFLFVIERWLATRPGRTPA